MDVSSPRDGRHEEWLSKANDWNGHMLTFRLCLPLRPNPPPPTTHVLFPSHPFSLKYTRSWPAVRRVITAGLALHRLRAGPLAAAGELMAVQLLLRLYLAHRTAAKAKRVVEFAHVSKSGGTTMCQLAERNGCRTESFALSRNCLVSKFDDRVGWVVGWVDSRWCLRRGRLHGWARHADGRGQSV